MLRIDHLQKSFSHRVLFDNATYHFPEGERIALVGANGAGKTTLLNILCGFDTQDAGQVLVPRQVRVGYLPQIPNPSPAPTVLDECLAGETTLVRLKAAMDHAAEQLSGEPDAAERYANAEAAYRAAGGYSLAARGHEILAGLGFSPQQLDQDPRQLSGGWRMRLELARLFLRAPDFLILDEPTNHLDLPSLVWVEDYLRSFRGTLLFVSHDRALLNRLATVTLHLANSRLTPYSGNFDAFLNARAERAAQEQAELTQLRRRREQMERFVERFGAKATKATQAQSRVKMIARLRDLEDTLSSDDLDSDIDLQITIPEPPKTPRLLLEIDDGAIGYDVQRPLARGIKVQVERGAKIAIIGANGIGKSTLLRTLAKRVMPLSGIFALAPGVELAYFSQDQSETLDQDQTLLVNLLRASDMSEKAARGLLGAFLFRGDDVFKPVRVLSGGEQSRLGLACALAKRCGLLLLDEPTNHLDMASVESLAASLEAYAGTLLFVSHDRAFIDAVCTHVFAMLPDGRSMLFQGKLDDYARLAALAGFPNVLSHAPVNDGTPPPARQATAATGVASPAGASEAEVKELKRQRQKLSGRQQKLDAELQQACQDLANVESALAKSSDYAQTSTLHAEQVRLQEVVARTEAEWLSVAEDLESISTTLVKLGRA